MERILIEDLKKVRALIATRTNWTQGTRGRTNPDGTLSRCILGAVEDVTGEEMSGPTILSLFREIPDPRSLPVDTFNREWKEDEWGWEAASVGRFNNTHSHADVIALIDRAIATASGGVAEEKPANLMRF